MAVTTSRPSNKSPTSLTMVTVITMPPTPTMRRPAPATQNPSAPAITKPPRAISPSPISTTRFSPNRRPAIPAGRAVTNPSALKNPISVPTSVKLMPRSSTSSGATEATVWNW